MLFCFTYLWCYFVGFTFTLLHTCNTSCYFVGCRWIVWMEHEWSLLCYWIETCFILVDSYIFIEVSWAKPFLRCWKWAWDHPQPLSLCMVYVPNVFSNHWFAPLGGLDQLSTTYKLQPIYLLVPSTPPFTPSKVASPSIPSILFQHHAPTSCSQCRWSDIHNPTRP